MRAKTVCINQPQPFQARSSKADSAPCRSSSRLLAGLGFAALLLASAPALAQVLGTASNFGVLAGTAGVTNTGSTVVNGSVGVFPAASITGFPPGLIVPGTGFLHFGDATAQQAQSDTTAAYLALANLVPTAAPIGPELGGLTLGPGIYNAGAATLNGTLTLSGAGLYVFQTTSLVTASVGSIPNPLSSVSLINGATPCDIWWQVGSSAAIGTFSAVQGNILALTSITLGTSANLQGRALARNGTVTLAGNVVTACTGGTAPGYLVGALVPVPPPPPGPIPTISEWAMIMLAAFLAIAGFAAIRKRAK